MFRLRMIGKIIRQAGLGYITLVFFAIFCLCALGVMLGSSSVETYGDALWLCFQTVTTIGFGDLPTTGALCRVSLVFLSVVSIFYLAVITGVVVAYCNQLIERQGHESMARITDELEHLDELSPQQLRELSARIKSHQVSRD